MILLIAGWLVFVSLAILFIIVREEKLIAEGKVPLGRLRRLWFRKNRRRSPRFRTDALVRYRRMSTEEAASASARANDISETGVGLVVQNYLQTGSTLQLEFTIPGLPNPLPVTGTVVWVRPVRPRDGRSSEEKLFFIGVQFLNADPAIAAHLKALLGIAAKAPPPGNPNRG